MGENLTGACLCGEVRFEITKPLGQAGYCHCTRCQRRTGTAAAVSAALEPDSLRFTSGEELVKAWQPDEGFAKLFCSSCGSALFSQAPDSDRPSAVRLGVIAGDPGVRPSFHQFVSYAAPWEPIPDDGLERFPERRT